MSDELTFNITEIDVAPDEPMKQRISIKNYLCLKHLPQFISLTIIPPFKVWMYQNRSEKCQCPRPFQPSNKRGNSLI